MPFTKQSAREIQFKRWRDRRGLKFVCLIKPLKKGVHTATCIFEGNEYQVVASSNIEALNKLCNLIKEKI